MNPSARPRRSALYLPASNARAVDKARSLPCDVVILDLEDAVAPDAKAEARAGAVEAVKAGGFGGREVVIRVNGLDTPWGADDLAAAAAAKPDAVLVPKVSAPEDLSAARTRLGDHLPIWAMIETCAAMFRLDALGAESVNVGVEAWVIGSNDLAKEMRCALTVGREPLLTALSLSLMAARAHRLAILDGVFNEIADADGLARQCAQAAAFGFDGKSLIHPSQVDAANAAFTPDAAAVAWARTVVGAFDLPENAGKGVLKVEGRMVERLHFAEAKRLLSVAEAIAARDAA
ncbi:MAG: CoA ester lyase [Alphaproteobacteria bacterium]|nr:CoA ester lyase [Alphaproteobacteria bacterium]MBU1514853.1 CoA ester lyase [Alphaproteobacteria bacterium]MBU2093774.1 CoA ester lyase [Alphaproteobacteria bacterium]MBU2149395.1 CoA ester lyase [Alphaproteobacteria bacterium]MBU2305355.1 CoA ester lyase [Alphaproteobacteria bacterium]